MGAGMTEHLDDRPYTAVASRSSLTVDTHLGKARRLQIWSRSAKGGFRLLEERPAKLGCGGPDRWEDLAKDLSDCRAILVQAAGDEPRRVFAEQGLNLVVCSGGVKDALAAVYG
jgi:nitrogen fixation protein NifB